MEKETAMKLKRSSLFMKIVILALIVYAAISLVGAKNKIATAEEDQALLRAKVDTMLRENAELEYDVAHAGDPETIESVARTKLGLVMPGEKIFFDVGN